ncbi:hypothetical protein SteCoe_3488 [Stentor coeruleus]|uniref:Uncharacterized protein n=1 Tax=Stentor coeruleus TaxID=5963 RepID=A0A1R2CWY8_9CILI|nr:hypothetical protein SteCoe_3488 [Stentor coeruleus]
MCMIEGVSKSAFSIHSGKLDNQIAALKDIKGCELIEYKIIYYLGRFLEDTSKYRKLILMPQPYTFYNVKESKDCHHVTLKYAIYTIDSKIGKDSFRHVNNNIQIDPADIMETNVYTELKCTDKSLYTNGEFEICTFYPVQVFYTLLLIPYEGKFPRILVCKNVLTINDRSNFGQILSELSYSDHAMKLNKLSQAKEQLDMVTKGYQIFRNEIINNLCQIVAGTSSQEKIDFFKDLLYYYIWINSGNPDALNFGCNEYKRLTGEVSNGNEDSNEFLKKCLASVLGEINSWISKIN